MMRIAGIYTALILIFASCENRSLTEGEKFAPKEIHENKTFHFDKINVDGVEYLILEKDNNNPHEGFGFMAFRANKLIEKQDSILAYMKTLIKVQSIMLSEIKNISQVQADDIVGEILVGNLEKELEEIYLLENSKLSSGSDNEADSTSQEE
ncbi:MAG: hypothetical protein JXQ90_09490 [Cyclobacteriaceae bacterium]